MGKSKSKRNKKKKKKSKNIGKKKKKKQAMNVINMYVPKNSKVIISNAADNNKKRRKSKAENVTLSDALLENMIQIQHEMFCQLNHSKDGQSNATHPYQTSSESHALSTNEPCDVDKDEDEDAKLEITETAEQPVHKNKTRNHLNIPNCKHDRNASFSSSMNGHLMHFHEEEVLEISNENSRRRTILSTPITNMTHHEQQNDVLDLDESVYAEHDYDDIDCELKEELPTISEMSFNEWSLPTESIHENVQNVNKKHKHEKIIESFVKNNEFVYKKIWIKQDCGD